MPRLAGDQRAIVTADDDLGGQGGDAEHDHVEQQDQAVIATRDIPQRRDRRQGGQHDGDAGLRRDQRPQDLPEIVAQSRQRVDHEEAGQAQHKRRQQQEGHLHARVEQLVQPPRLQPAERPHHRAVEQSADEHENQQPAQTSHQGRINGKDAPAV